MRSPRTQHIISCLCRHSHRWSGVARIRVGYGLHCVTSAKAVMRQGPHEGFLTRKEVPRYSRVIPRSSGWRKTCSLFKFVKHNLKLFKLDTRVLRDASFALRGLYCANVDCRLNGNGCTTITGCEDMIDHRSYTHNLSSLVPAVERISYFAPAKYLVCMTLVSWILPLCHNAALRGQEDR